MAEISKIVDKWFILLSYCEDKENFDAKEFKKMHDDYSSWHKSLNYEEQGHVTEMIKERYGF